jgi:hypothetical protein
MCKGWSLPDFGASGHVWQVRQPLADPEGRGKSGNGGQKKIVPCQNFQTSPPLRALSRSGHGMSAVHPTIWKFMAAAIF